MGDKMKRKLIIIIIAILTAVILVASLMALREYQEKKNQEEIDSAIHGVVIAKDTPFYLKPETENVRQIRLLKKSDNVYILDEFENNDIKWYKVKVDGKINGYVRAEDVDYYKEVNKEKVLVSDVSQFNSKDFETSEDYEVFLLENKINYVYIRAGGRGYGSKGNFYEDTEYQKYIDACEYLKIPYGFYFLDEALDDKEINEEVDFIQEFLDKHSGKYCKLPVALDIEKHDGKGRADDIWNERAEIVQKLINKLNRKKIDNIVYTNAQTANLYLSSLDTKFWIAYYPQDEKIPDYWYFDTKQEGAENMELYKKTVGWQFSETGAGDEVVERVDLSLFKKEFYK
jgi:GH25 family lysozyme M1 (1,4-beta-N-acetylmuramidase)